MAIDDQVEAPMRTHRTTIETALHPAETGAGGLQDRDLTDA